MWFTRMIYMGNFSTYYIFFYYYLTKVRLCLYTCHNYILPCVVSEIIIIILLNRYFYVFLCLLLLFYFYLIFVLHFVLLKSNITVDIRTMHYNHTLTTIKKILIQRKHFLNIPLCFDFFFFFFCI